MPAESYRYYAGAWRKAKNIYIKNGGVWRDCTEVWTKYGGSWRLVFTRGSNLTLNASGYDYNVYNAARSAGWDGFTPLTVNVIVNGNVGSSVAPTIDWDGYMARNPDVVAAGQGYPQGVLAFVQHHYLTAGVNEGRQLTYNYGPAAFDTGPLPAGSVVNLTINAGTGICGAGGTGGYGGFWNRQRSHNIPSTPGAGGSTAIRARCAMVIINNGIIGGGGGGGGGGAGAGGGEGYDDPGGGGGGGAGIVQGPGGASWRAAYNGQTGLIGKGGAGGVLSNQGSKEWAQATAGGNGGNLGQPGAASAASNGGPGCPGGPAGYAIEGVGNVTWQLYGDVRGPTA